jgi:hypothetical protein
MAARHRSGPVHMGRSIPHIRDGQVPLDPWVVGFQFLINRANNRLQEESFQVLPVVDGSFSTVYYYRGGQTTRCLVYLSAKMCIAYSISLLS